MVVYATHNLPEAYIVAGRLQHEGIPAMVHTQTGAGAIGITIGRLGEVTVLVNFSDYERALTILDVSGPEELPDNTDDISFLWPDDGDEIDDYEDDVNE